MEDALKRLITLAFPQMVIGRGWLPKPRMDISRTDTDNMSEAEYNQWFPSQGRVDKSYPVASVVGPVKVANLLRKWLLGRAVKPKPTTAPLALGTDEENEQTETPRLTYGRYSPIRREDWSQDTAVWDFGELSDSAYDRGLKRRNRFLHPEEYSLGRGEFPFGETPAGKASVPRDEQGRLMYRPESGTYSPGGEQFYMEGPPTNKGEFTPWGNMSEPRQYPGLVEPSTGMQPSVDGFEYNTTGVDWIDDETPTLWEKLEAFYRVKKKHDPLEDDIPEGFYEDLLQGKIPSIGQDPAYPHPEGYRSLLSELATGDKVYEDYTAEEKNSMKRELKERSRVGGSVYDGLMNDQPAMTKYLEKNPLQMTVHTIKDTWGAENPEDMVSMLYFGGEDRPGWATSHYSGESGDLSDDALKEPQAFVRWDITPQGNVFNVKEAQIDMRWERGKATPPFMKESIRKLAQQTVIDLANSTSDTIRIPLGEAIFEKNHGKLSDFGDDAYFVTLEDDDKFEAAMKESRSLERDPRLPTGEDSTDATASLAFNSWPGFPAETLRELRAQYWGKKRHYDKYQKALIQALKESGAHIEDVTPERPYFNTKAQWFKIKNPDEFRQRVEDKPFPMAMLLKRIADRQVA